MKKSVERIDGVDLAKSAIPSEIEKHAEFTPASQFGNNLLSESLLHDILSSPSFSHRRHDRRFTLDFSPVLLSAESHAQAEFMFNPDRRGGYLEGDRIESFFLKWRKLTRWNNCMDILSRKSILDPLRQKVAEGRPILGGGTGRGVSAKLESATEQGLALSLQPTGIPRRPRSNLEGPETLPRTGRMLPKATTTGPHCRGNWLKSIPYVEVRNRN